MLIAEGLAAPSTISHEGIDLLTFPIILLSFLYNIHKET